MSITDVTICHATSEDDFTQVQFLFRAYLFPVTYLFGIISNTINALVFSQKAMRAQPVNLFFLALSISDLITLVSSFFVFSVPVYAESSRNLEATVTSVQLILWFYPMAQTGLTMSVYVTILVSVHRYLGVCHPFLIRRISNSSAVKVVILTCVIFSFLFNISRWFELYALPCYSALHKSDSVIVFPTELMINEYYTLIYRNGAYTLVMFLMPFAILSFVNFRIIATLKKSYNLRREMMKGAERPSAPKEINGNSELIVAKVVGQTAVTSADSHTTNDRKENGVTIMLIAITTEFLLFNLLAFANNLIELMSTYGHKIFGGKNNLETVLVEVSTLLVNINGASTIIIYVIFGSKYRTVLSKLIQKHLRPSTVKHRKRSMMMSHAQFETTQLIDGGIGERKLMKPNRKFSEARKLTDDSGMSKKFCSEY